MIDEQKMNEEQLENISGGTRNDIIKITGTVIECLPNATIRVELDDGKKIVAHISNKLRMDYVKFIPNQRVEVEMSPYDSTTGKIVKKLK